MQRRYITVDVFTDRAFGGNPLGVVLDAGGLSTAQMQAIAIEFNYSETTFVLPPQDPAHDAQVRIFTVNRELPFAGHPNVGTAFVLATRAAKPPARLLFEEKARPGAGRDRDRAGQGRQHRIDRAAAAEADVAAQRGAGRGLPLAVGGRCEDRSPSRRRSSRSGCRSSRSNSLRAMRCGGRSRMRQRSQKPSRWTAATRSISTRAMCRPTKSPLTCRRGCSTPAPADCPKTPPLAARLRPPRHCSRISIPRAMAN